MAAIERLSVLRYVTTTKKSKRYLRAMYVMNAANASVAMSGQLNFDLLIRIWGARELAARTSVTNRHATNSCQNQGPMIYAKAQIIGP